MHYMWSPQNNFIMIIHAISQSVSLSLINLKTKQNKKKHRPERPMKFLVWQVIESCHRSSIFSTLWHWTPGTEQVFSWAHGTHIKKIWSVLCEKHMEKPKDPWKTDRLLLDIKCFPLKKVFYLPFFSYMVKVIFYRLEWWVFYVTKNPCLC